MKKNVLYLLLAALPIIIHAQDATQRLIIPKLQSSVRAKGGIIKLQAFCADATRWWPEYGSKLNNIHWGENSSVTVSENQVQRTISLSNALKTGIVHIESSRSGVNIKADGNTKIVSLVSNGFVVGEKQEEIFFSQDILNVLPQTNSTYTYLDYNGKVEWGMSSSTYKHYSDVVWEKVHGPEMKILAIKTMRINEYAKNILSDTKYRGIPKTWEIKVQEDKVVIKDKLDGGGGGGGGHFDTYETLRNITKDIDGSVCLNLDPTDSNLTSISITGKYKSVPIEIEFSSNANFKVSAELYRQKMKNKPVEISYNISYASEPGSNDDCNLKLTGSVCYPFAASSLNLDICGKNMAVSPRGLSFGIFPLQ
jgi:hypothetical protein